MFDLYTTSFGRFLAYGITASEAKDDLVTRVRDLVAPMSPHGKFPGPNPCSIERRDFQKFVDPKAVYLCEKTDGLRALLVCLTFRGERVVVLVARNWEPYLLPLARVPKVLFQGTVLDGELVCDTGRWSWLCFDAVLVAGIPVWYLSFGERLDCARRALKDYSYDHDNDPLDVRIKTFFRGDQAREYVAHLRQLTVPVDGTVITPAADPVGVGRHTNMYKLKDKHTVDFVFTLPDALAVFDPAHNTHVQVARLKISKNTGPLPPEGSIIECLPTSIKGALWEFVTLRTDKNTANDLLTFNKTRINARERLTLDDVVGALLR